MNNIFANQKPVSHNGRNGFDNSFSRCFVMRPSVVRPVACIETVPNSSYRIRVQDIVRTDALQTAAFLRGKQELDFFFVPYSQLYSRSNDVILSGSDIDMSSPAFSGLNGQEMPTIPLITLVSYAVMPYFWMRYIQEISKLLTMFDTYYFTRNLEVPEAWLTYLTFDYYNHRLGSAMTSGRVSHWEDMRMIAYRAPNNINFSTDNKFWLSSFVSATTDCDLIGADAIQLLSTLDYGDYYNVAKSYFDLAIEHSKLNDLSWVEQQIIDDVDNWDTIITNFCDKIFDSWELLAANVSQFDERVNLFRLAAYQKVWNDVYRDSINDDNRLYLWASSLDYNVDQLVSNFFEPKSSDNINLSFTLMRPRLRRMRRDLSTGLYSSTQKGGYGNSSDLGEDPDYDSLNIPEELGRSDSTSAVAIQFALAMQRYRQTLLRAGSRMRDLLNAQFGVKSHYIEDHYVRHIGSFDGSLDINRVSATADSGTYSVGDLAGNVFSSLNGDTIDFTCNDHGIIIACMSFICDPLHNAFGVSPFNIKSKTLDYYHEQFENLGLQPVDVRTFDVYANPRTIGFGARYNEYKQRFDTVHDNFMTHLRLPIDREVPEHGLLRMFDGSNSNYVVVRPVAQTLSNLKDRVYILPSCMDTIFKNFDTGDPDNAHFAVAMDFSISCVLPMSVTGLI